METSRQREAWELVKKSKLTYREAASRLNIKVSSLFNLVKDYEKNIKKKQALGVANKADSTTHTPQLTNTYIRRHGLHYVVTPYYLSDFYKKLVKTRKNIIPEFHGWRIEINRENIEIISLEETDFRGADIYIACANEVSSLNTIIKKLENRLKVGIIKNDYMNIKLCKQHTATVKDGIAISIHDNESIVLYNNNGEAWFMWDESKNEVEWETIHSETSKLDHALVNKYIGDFKNNPLNNSELTSRINDIITALDKMTELLQNKL